MGLHPVDAGCGEELHWKLSPVSLQYNAADLTVNDNFGVALEATWQVTLVRTNLTPETYDVCRVHTSKRQGAMDYVTLAIVGRFCYTRQRTQFNRLCMRHAYNLASHFVKAFLYKRLDAMLS